MSSKRLRYSYLVVITFLVFTLSILALSPAYVKAQTPAEGQTYVIGRYKTLPVPYNATIINVFLSDIKNDGNYAVVWISKSGLVRTYSLDGNTIWVRSLNKTITYALLEDVDSDNLPELVLGTSDGHIIELDPASFGRTVFDTYLKSDLSVLKIVPVNFDADIQSEFVVIQKNGPIIYVDNNGAFLKIFRYYATSADIVAADVDNDGQSELIIVTSSGDIRLIYSNETEIFSTSIIGENFTSVLTKDVDGDGTPEFFIAGKQTLYIYSSDGAQLNTRSFDNTISKISLVDLDGNGFFELIMLSGSDLYSFNSRTMFLNKLTTIPSQYSISDLAFLNLDSDSALEILLTSNQGVIIIYNNDLSLFRTYTVEVGSPIYSCTVVDLDGDGYDEFAVAGKLRNMIILGIDTDGDGLLNIEENTITKTNPNLVDTDGDQMSDYNEYLNGRNPLAYDSDYDGIPDSLDLINGINDAFFYAVVLLVFIGVPGYKYMQLRKEETM